MSVSQKEISLQFVTLLSPQHLQEKKATETVTENFLNENKRMQGLKIFFLTLPNIDSSCALPEVYTGNMEKFCAFTMAWKLLRYISEVSHKYNNHMIISTNLGTLLDYLCSSTHF